jgi:DNA-binding transcriptional ArsR family regulator
LNISLGSSGGPTNRLTARHSTSLDWLGIADNPSTAVGYSTEMLNTNSATPSDVVRTFAALGDPVRQSIVERLADGDASVNDLAAMFPISLQAVSRHIKVLESAGVVSRRRAAQSRPVHLEAASLARSADWLERHRQRLETRYQRLDDYLQERKDPSDQ